MTTHGPGRHPGRWNLALLAAVFFAPLAVAVWLYFSSAWRPGSGTQHGELIDPPRPLPGIALALPDGRAASPDVLRGRWHLIYFGDGPCGSPCVAALAELRAVRSALGKDSGRVRRVLLHDGRCCAPGFPAPPGADLLVLGASGPEGRAFLALFPPMPGGGAAIYVVDPLGNLMMRHPVTGLGPGLLKDLERLLRLSSIG